MKLWDERDVLPFKSETGLLDYQKRKERGLEAAATREQNLANWFEDVKTSNPTVREILHKLREIGQEIKDLRHEKEHCREKNPEDKAAYFDLGTEHWGD